LFLISLSVENGGIENLATGTTYSSIQFAINDASEGNEIVINPGFYQENILFKAKNLTLRSIDPNDPDVVGSTVIEGVPHNPVITMSSSRDNRDGVCILDGLTITGGDPELDTQSISCCDVAPIIRNCFIESNGPNAIEFWEGYEPIIVDCTILRPGQTVPAIVAYWSLDEAESIAAHDSFFDNYAYINGNPVWQPSDGKVGGALQLDGIDDYLSTPFILNPTNSDFSVFAWIKSGSAGQVILSQEGGANWLMADAIDGVLKTDLREPGKTGQTPIPPGPSLRSTTVVTDGDWHRVGFVRDGINRILYVDDIEVAHDTATNLEAADGGLYIGASKDLDAGAFFSGLIDDVRIYTRALNAEEIGNLPLYLISSAADSGGVENLTTGRIKNLTAGKTYNNISFAITDASEGDEIVINEGIYQENINFKGKNLILRSKNPNDPSVVAVTVINGGAQGSVVTFSGGEDVNFILAGFTITGGNAENGGGIYCGYKSSPTITNCTITNNSATMGGGGIYIEGDSNPVLTNCTIINNSASVAGGGLYNQFSNPTLTNCTFSGNSANYFGGGICFSSGSPVLTNCILWSNILDEISMLGGTPVVTYSDVQGGFIGEGNIDADPLFADSDNGDYHLKSQAGRWNPISQSWIQDDVTSPCIDAGDPTSPIGLEPSPNGGIINMGVYGRTIEASKSP
jgi:parallel beta-helix repeat protein